MAEKDSNLEMINKEAVDLENIPMEEVFSTLRCTREGLTSGEADGRLKIFGYNKLEEKQESKIFKFSGFMWNPLSWVMEAVAIMAIALANGGRRPPDWHDFVGIIILLIINSTISFIHGCRTRTRTRTRPTRRQTREGQKSLEIQTWPDSDILILKHESERNGILCT